MTIERVLIVGTGFMGHGIAQACAAAGRTVALYEPDTARAVAGRDRIAGNLARSVEKGRLDAAERDAILARLTVVEEIAGAGPVDLAVEAAPEDAVLKASILTSVDAAIPGGAILATNTSSISIDALAAGLRPERRPLFLGLHFFSPVPVMPLVEIVHGSATGSAVLAEAHAFAAALGKTTVDSADRPGFIVNRMLMPFLAEAMLVLEEGTATAADIDTGAKLGLNHPMGPLELADFIGLDVCLGIMRVIEADLGARFAPPASLVALVEAGDLGRKSGRGFHVYG